MLDAIPEEYQTPMETIMGAYDRILEDEKLSGGTLECSGQNIYFRKKPEYPDKSQEWLGDDLGGVWTQSYEQKRTPAM